MECHCYIYFLLRSWFEPRSNIPWLKKIIWVIGVLRTTVVCDSEDGCRMHRLSKRQSQTTVLLRTPITQMIFFNQGYFLLSSYRRLRSEISILQYCFSLRSPGFPKRFHRVWSSIFWRMLEWSQGFSDVR